MRSPVSATLRSYSDPNCSCRRSDRLRRDKQLIGHVLTSFGRRLEQVRITEVRNNIFYAELILDRDTRVSARVSDAVALALHLSIPIQAEDAVLDTAAVINTVTRVEADDPGQADDVEQFRRFLDGASPEDFDADEL